jgi:hypothetical protein
MATVLMTLISAALTAGAAVKLGSRIARPIAAATLRARRFPIMALPF